MQTQAQDCAVPPPCPCRKKRSHFRDSSWTHSIRKFNNTAVLRKWGRQSCLQPPFRRLSWFNLDSLKTPPERRLQAGLPAPQDRILTAASEERWRRPQSPAFQSSAKPEMAIEDCFQIRD